MFITPRSSTPFLPAEPAPVPDPGPAARVPVSTASSQRDVVDHVQIERDRMDTPGSGKDVPTPSSPPADGRRDGVPATRAPHPEEGTPRAAEPAAEVPFAEWIERARSAGHPVITVVAGRFGPNPMPVWHRAMPPLELLEAAQEYARAQVQWVHVVMPSMAAMFALSTAIAGPRPAGPARRRGSPASIPWRVLVAQQRIAPRATSVTRDGVTAHTVEVPVSWLSFPIYPVGPSL